MYTTEMNPMLTASDVVIMVLMQLPPFDVVGTDVDVKLDAL